MTGVRLNVSSQAGALAGMRPQKILELLRLLRAKKLAFRRGGGSRRILVPLSGGWESFMASVKADSGSCLLQVMFGLDKPVHSREKPSDDSLFMAQSLEPGSDSMPCPTSARARMCQDAPRLLMLTFQCVPNWSLV